MLPRRHRISGSRTRRRAVAHARTRAGEYTAVRWTPNSRDHSRFAVSVSAKKIPRAAARNRIKRILREQIRTRIASVPPGYDVVVAWRGKDLPTHADTLSSELHRALAHIR